MNAKFICLIILLISCSMALAIDPWGNPTVLTGSMTVMALVTINGSPASSGDVLGAFVAVEGVPQLRGKATVLINGSIAGCLIQIYTEINGETISFKVWDNSDSLAYDANQILPSEVNGIVGSYPDNMYQITAGQTTVTDPWPEPAILTGSMVVMAQVSINGEPATNEDILAAFVTVAGQEQLRGKEHIAVNNGIPGCLLQVYTENDGEVITFKVWNHGNQQILSDSQTMVSEVNGSVGSWPDNLYQINATLLMPQVATPIFNPSAGIYPTVQNVTISCATPDATIHYTTNGTDPTISSPVYTTSISCPLNSATIIKARGFKNGWTFSPMASAIFLITGTVDTPIFSPAGGTYQSFQYVIIDCSTPGATIRYTTNGNDPDASSPIYTTPIYCPQNSTTTIKARGYKNNWTPSSVATAVYYVSSDADDPYAVPLFTGIYSVYPNPFSSQTTIRIGFKEANADYSLNIYNIKGELVYETSGIGKGYVEHCFSGNNLASGIYFCTMETGGKRSLRKMLLLK